jgi:lipoprotein-anchoring transpeptidase ErfK/SrfK
MNQTKLLIMRTPWYQFPVQISLFIAILILTVVVVTAGPQNSRKRITAPDTQGEATPKKVARNKPLTAADHRAAEQRLADLGYWTGPIDGRWDATSHHALIAFQKVERMKPTGQLNRAVFEAILAANRPSPLEKGPAHIEVDLIRQALFVVDDDGVVSHILPVSSGSGKEFISQGWARDAITHPGRYKVLQKIPGWKKSPLGRLYYPVYFMYGTAIHGYQSVPTKPASHGCVRIPMVVAKDFFKMIPVGMPVIVHRGDPPAPLPVLSSH